eukprot:Nk52_evm1s780 gene=Nk52_evmTU1s780
MPLLVPLLFLLLFVTPAADTKQVFNFGRFDQFPHALPYLLHTRAFDTADWEFHSISITSGVEGLKLLNSEFISISGIGSSPTSMGVQRGMDIVVVYNLYNIGDLEGLTIQKSLNITTPRGIKASVVGRKLVYGTPLGSTSHFHALLGLQAFGLTASDVDMQLMGPGEMYGKWDKKELDMVYVWNPMYRYARDNGGHILYTS